LTSAKQTHNAHYYYTLLLLAKKLVNRAAQLKGTTAEAFAVAGMFCLIYVFSQQYLFNRAQIE
jgi:hypothetical protein